MSDACTRPAHYQSKALLWQAVERQTGPEILYAPSVLWEVRPAKGGPCFLNFVQSEPIFHPIQISGQFQASTWRF